LKEERREALVKDIMNTHVVTISQSATISEAARMMKCSGVGCILVKDASDILGIVTERDIVKFLATGHSDMSTVGDIASKSVITVGPTETVNEATRILAEKGIKRLPVLDGKCLVGLLTSTDLVRYYNKLSKYALKDEGP
jgi:CBS domain-containing protein